MCAFDENKLNKGIDSKVNGLERSAENLHDPLVDHISRDAIIERNNYWYKDEIKINEVTGENF